MLNISRFSTVIAIAAVFIGSTVAQRPNSASVCDYYAQALYGANSSDTQQRLVQNIVSLAFAGGANLTNVSYEITGILQPGQFQGVDIDLQPYFNGSKKSTNLNNEPISINWLDEGGREPLVAFLNGSSDTVPLTNSSNQYHLFGNFYVAFSRAFGCTLPIPPLPSSHGPLSLAYVHKFMSLEYNQLGHFIDQLTKASQHFGFSEQDGATFSTRLNSLYNVRCAPAITFNPASGPQLLSLCQNPTCPLAAPVSDCGAYVNLTANAGSSSNTPSTVVTTATASATSSPSSTSSSASASSAAPAGGSKALSTGGIAGVAIGGAAVVLMAIVALVFLLRRRRKDPQPPPSHVTDWTQSQQQYSSPTMYSASPNTAKDPHMSYYSTGQPMSEMDNSRYQSSGGLTPNMGSPPPTQNQWTRPVEMGNSPVEMEGGGYAQHGHGQQWQGDNIQRQPGM